MDTTKQTKKLNEYSSIRSGKTLWFTLVLSRPKHRNQFSNSKAKAVFFFIRKKKFEKLYFHPSVNLNQKHCYDKMDLFIEIFATQRCCIRRCVCLDMNLKYAHIPWHRQEIYHLLFQKAFYPRSIHRQLSPFASKPFDVALSNGKW